MHINHLDRYIYIFTPARLESRMMSPFYLHSECLDVKKEPWYGCQLLCSGVLLKFVLAIVIRDLVCIAWQLIGICCHLHRITVAFLEEFGKTSDFCECE